MIAPTVGPEIVIATNLRDTSKRTKSEKIIGTPQRKRERETALGHILAKKSVNIRRGNREKARLGHRQTVKEMDRKHLELVALELSDPTVMFGSISLHLMCSGMNALNVVLKIIS